MCKHANKKEQERDNTQVSIILGKKGEWINLRGQGAKHEGS